MSSTAGVRYPAGPRCPTIPPVLQAGANIPPLPALCSHCQLWAGSGTHLTPRTALNSKNNLSSRICTWQVTHPTWITLQLDIGCGWGGRVMGGRGKTSHFSCETLPKDTSSSLVRCSKRSLSDRGDEPSRKELHFKKPPQEN